MPGHTARLNLYQPGGGSEGTHGPDEQVDIDRINDDLALIDAAVGAPVYTSGTRPSTPYDGQLIYETDTGFLKVYHSGWKTCQVAPTYNVADLDALLTLYPSTVEGQIVHVDNLNVNFQNQDSNMKQIDIARVPAATNRTTEYAKAGGVYLVAGIQCVIGADMSGTLSNYDGTNWVSQDTGWVSATLGSGWTAFSGETPGYRRLNGVVYLKGRASSTGATATAFTLPAGFRPIAQLVMSGNDGTAFIQAIVTSAGIVGPASNVSATNFSFGQFSPFIADN